MRRIDKGKLNGAKILITGGAGHIGSQIVHDLLEYPVSKIIIIDNLSRGKSSNLNDIITDPRIKFIKGDIREYNLINEISKGIDFLYHEAVIRVSLADKKPLLCKEVMVDATHHIFETAAKYGVKKIVFTSSASVYGEPMKTPISETDPTNARSIYGFAKIYAEQLLNILSLVYRFDYTILRLFNVYGPKMDFHTDYCEVIAKWIHAARKNGKIEIFGNGKNRYDFTYTEDVSRAHILALDDCANGEIFNVGSGTATTLNTLAQKIKTKMKSSSEITHLSPEKRFVALKRLANIEKINKLLGYKPKFDLDSGLSKTIKSYI